MNLWRNHCAPTNHQSLPGELDGTHSFRTVDKLCQLLNDLTSPYKGVWCTLVGRVALLLWKVINQNYCNNVPLLERVIFHSTCELSVQTRVKTNFTLRLVPSQALNRRHLMRVELVRIERGLALVLQVVATSPIAVKEGIATIATIKGHPADLTQ